MRSSVPPRGTTAVRCKAAVSAIPAVYNVVEPRPGWVCREFGLKNIKHLEIEFTGRPSCATKPRC